MTTLPIGVFDSGVGGLSVLKYAVTALPKENFIYFGDSANAPYGEKTDSLVLELTVKAVDFLSSQGIKALVVACNTATSVAVDFLRQKYAFPIISMEPAIKPALEKTDGKVLLLATNVTLKSRRVNSLIEKYDKENRVIKVSCPHLAKKIEETVFGNCDIDGYLSGILRPYADIGATAAVLGCTHYPFVKDRIERILGKISVFDGIDGTIGHLKHVLAENGLENFSGGNVKIESSRKDKDTLELYNKLLLGGKV